MWKAVFVPMLVILASAPVHADFASECPAVKSGCSSEYIATSQKLRGGDCAIQTETDCEIFASASQGCIDSSSIYGQNGTCREIGVEQDVECWANAAASAFASAAVHAECKGKGKACVRAETEASATACAVAQAIIDIAIIVGKDKEPACQTAVASVMNATVSVSANAMASACAKRKRPGMDKDFAFSSDVKSVITSAFGSCWVYCKDVDGKQQIAAEAEGRASGADVTPAQNTTDS